MTNTTFQTAGMNNTSSFKKFSSKANAATAPLFASRAGQSQDTFCAVPRTQNLNATNIPLTSSYRKQPFQITFQAAHPGFLRPDSYNSGTCDGVPFTEHEVSNGSGKMTFIRFQRPNSDAVGAKAAELLQGQIIDYFAGAKIGTPIIITPTGNTPMPFYRSLRENDAIPWENLTLGHLDEYVKKPGLGLPEEETYRAYMHHHLWGDEKLHETEKWAVADQPEFQSARTPEKYDEAIRAYEQKIKERGGPLTVVLGIGPNGHIAFTEPPSEQEMAGKTNDEWFRENSPAHWTKLKESTLRANFGDQAEREEKGYTDEAVTLGFDTILSAKHIILLATGKNKEGIVRNAFRNFNEAPTPYIPASYLKKHPDVTVITDF